MKSILLLLIATAFSFTAHTQVTDVDSNLYQTIKIGNQEWMAENLKTTRYNDGELIPLVTDNSTWSNLSSPAYCWHTNDSTLYSQTYGALYNWHTIKTNKLCPVGWHVPTDADWTTLTNYLGDDAGGKLKETGTTYWASHNTEASNETGFNALPGDLRQPDGEFYMLGYSGYWWTSTIKSDRAAWYRRMDNGTSYVSRYSAYTQAGFSVRCIKD